MNALKLELAITFVNCCACGVPIGLTNEDSLRRSHNTFFCQAGHRQAFNGDTAEMKTIKDELAREKQRREIAEREALHERKRAEEAERKVKRSSKGVCTCCNRSFTNLQRHMQTQHPREAK